MSVHYGTIEASVAGERIKVGGKEVCGWKTNPDGSVTVEGNLGRNVDGTQFIPIDPRPGIQRFGLSVNFFKDCRNLLENS